MTEERPTFWTNESTRKWLLQVLGLVLLFLLLALAVWLFYDYRIKQIDKQSEPAKSVQL